MNANCDHTMTEVMHRGENSLAEKKMLSYSFFDFLLLFLYLFAFKSAANEAGIISRYQKMQTFTNLKTKGQTIAKAN